MNQEIRFQERGKSIRFEVNGQLTQIGNQSPYFSITANEYENSILQSCGCMHEDILKHFPKLQDFVDMHLSDINGIPMHAIANGWYWLLKSLGNNFTDWPGQQTPEESFKIFCDHLRITERQGRDIQDTILNTIAITPGIDPKFNEAKKQFIEIVNAMFPRWKKEADNLISKYSLVVKKE